MRARAWFQHPPTANPAMRPPLDSPITCGEGGHLAAGRLCGTKHISNQIYLSKYIKGYLSNHPQYISIAIAKHSLQGTSGQLFSLRCTGLWPAGSFEDCRSCDTHRKPPSQDAKAWTRRPLLEARRPSNSTLLFTVSMGHDVQERTALQQCGHYA